MMKEPRRYAVLVAVIVLALLAAAVPAVADGNGDVGTDPTPGSTVPSDSAVPSRALLSRVDDARGDAVASLAFVEPLTVPTWVSIVLARIAPILL